MTRALLAFVNLLVIDVAFLLVLGALVTFLAYGKQAAFAVLKRNFLGYFSNPTGYVFLCLFVLLTSMAAFWPHEFFNNNLATLTQLNKWYTIIMLFFIPAITMSIWAEEKRQGTDELLLTLPADDFDIVIGKFLAAASIFTASLLFSQFSTYLVLVFLTLGSVDAGGFAANYLGYWFIGLAMISIGMIASFLTSNLTVGFILGALFNAPLAFASMSDTIAGNRTVARWLKNFSLSERFDDFARGVISTSSTFYFVLLVLVGLYLCMVLIGRRHWSGGKNGNQMFLHYLLRIGCLVAIAIFGSILMQNRDLVRHDATEGSVNSISDSTREMIRSLSKENEIVVDAFLSADVPEVYAKTKYQLISVLKEFEAVALANNIPLKVNINSNLESISDEAKLAEEQYGIVPNQIRVRERGAMSDKNVILGLAFKSGLERVVVPFVGSGVPVEFELIRALNTVSRPSRKRLGVLKTDAELNGGFSRTNFQQIPKQPIITELARQYEIVDIDPNSAISPSQCDVLLAVQPSSLSPEQMVNFTDAVKAGIPTAIFEDPRPVTFEMPGTGEPKQAPGGMFGGGAPPPPKGDIRPLWKAIGITMPGAPNPMTGGVNPDLAWHRYNPYPILADLAQASDLWVFVREEAAANAEVFAKGSEISNGLAELLFLFTGSIEHDPNRPKDIEIMDLITTGEGAGRLAADKLAELSRRRDDTSRMIQMLEGNPSGPQVLAVSIKSEGKKGEEKKSEDGQVTTVGGEPGLNVVYVADADCLGSPFIDIRNQPDQYEDFNFHLQNVTFVLNVVDVLAGEERFASVRRKEPKLSTLELVEIAAQDARLDEGKQREIFRAEYESARDEAEADRDKTLKDFRERVQKLQKEGTIDASKFTELQALLQQLQVKEELLNRKLKVNMEKLARDRDKKVAEARFQADRSIRNIQNYYKMLAVGIPPIPPLLIGIIVFVSRRLREREGISKNRLR